MIHKIIKYIFFVFFVNPILLIVLGLNIRNKQKLLLHGPQIIISNHNSHLDTMVLMSLFPLSMLPQIRPVAAGDYFLKNKFLAWFSVKILGIIPVQRKREASQTAPLDTISKALLNKQIIIFFPEGTRGEPEIRSDLKRGISTLAKRYPQVPITPVFLNGLGKALPRGEALLVPFICDGNIGDPLYWHEGENFIETIKNSFDDLAKEIHISQWQ